MANPIIKIKRSAVPDKIPTTTSLPVGEFGINTYDGKVFIQQDQGAVGVGSTIIVINPWSVGTGTNTYNTYFTSGKVGIGTTLPKTELNVVGVVSATSFIGDGSGLTNLPTGGGGGGSQWVTTAAGIHTLSNVGVGTTNPSTNLDVGGNVNVSGNLNSQTISISDFVINSGIVTTSSTSQAIIAQYSTSTYRSAKVAIQVSCGSSHKITELSLVHDGASVYLSEYGTVSNIGGSNSYSLIASFDSDISSGNFRILATPVLASSTTFKYMATLIKV